MTVEEIIKIAGVGATVIGALLGVAVALVNVLPNKIKADTERRQKADDELRKQRDELRSDIREKEKELLIVKAENLLLESKADHYKDEAYRLLEIRIQERGKCTELGTQCKQEFSPVALKPFTPLPMAQVATPTPTP